METQPLIDGICIFSHVPYLPVLPIPLDDDELESGESPLKKTKTNAAREPGESTPKKTNTSLPPSISLATDVATYNSEPRS